ncbi:MAG: N-acetyl sugar amidotransferase [Chloroflexi bacterium]|nr:N-acetyl sugar amidotransferase [Chloroflexota bacterium]
MKNYKILDQQLSNLPEEIKYCKRCVVSNQRPRIVFSEDGICSACHYSDLKKSSIDWSSREKELRDLCDQYRRTDGRFDVLVPASGGKDSARVAYELKYLYNMHPLTVTWAPFEYTPAGFINFRDFIKVGGFNNIMAWPNGHLHRKLSRIAFEIVGDNFLPFIYGQVSYPFHIAKQFDIKLVFFGENGEAEYSGDPKVFNLRGMPFELWAEQYFKGATIDDLVQYGLNETNYLKSSDFDESDLQFYRPPPIESMTEQGVEFHWFSYYKKWIPQENFYLASEHTGFHANPEGRSEGTYSKYASLDDKLDGLHYYMAFIKFGIGRTTSDAAHEIRDGHITREEGMALVRQFDGEFPARWFEESLKYLDITELEFWEVVDRFRPSHLWEKRNNSWQLKQPVYEDLPEFKDSGLPGYLSSLVALQKL